MVRVTTIGGGMGVKSLLSHEKQVREGVNVYLIMAINTMDLF